MKKILSAVIIPLSLAAAILLPANNGKEETRFHDPGTGVKKTLYSYDPGTGV